MHIAGTQIMLQTIQSGLIAVNRKAVERVKSCERR